jgi:hypothetical protein
MSDAVQILATQLSGQLATPAAYNALTAYTAGQSVSYLGANYYALVGSTGTTPGTDPTTWGLLTGSGAQAATILAASTAIVNGANAVAVSRQARRVGLLAAVSSPVALPPTTSLGQVAATWTEVAEANAFLASAQSLDAQLSVLRVTDSTGHSLASVIANIPQTAYAIWGNALVALASAYETLLGESLPA